MGAAPDGPASLVGAKACSARPPERRAVTDQQPTRDEGAGSEWNETDRAQAWPSVREQLPHVADAEAMLLDYLTPEPCRILDLGTGGGHLIGLLLARWPQAAAVGLDLSDQMLSAARARFSGDPRVLLKAHDLMGPLSDELG